MPKRQKKGESQADWIISLGIFMLYLAWFFLYIRPLTTEPETRDSLLRIIDGKIRQNATWTVTTVPLIISSNITASNEPIIAKFAYDWNDTSFTVPSNQSFVIHDGRIIIISNITAGKSLLQIARSPETYTKVSQAGEDLAAARDSTSVNRESFRADFSGSLPDTIVYKGRTVLRNFSIELDSTKASFHNSSFNSTSTAAIYKAQAQLFNHTSYIVAGKARVYSYIDLNNPLETSQNLTISATLPNGTHYYADEESGGINRTGCRNSNTNYLDVYDETGGISFIFIERANISLCMENSTLRLKAYFKLKNDTSYRIMAHQGDYNSTLRYKSPYTANFGAKENLQGLSSKKLGQLNSTAYAALRSSWAIPKTAEFSYRILNSTDGELYKYEPKAPDPSSNIYVKETDARILHIDGRRETAKIRVKTW